MTTGLQSVASDTVFSGVRSRRRARRRQLHCPDHPDKLIQGNGKKYFLHLLSPEELKQRGYSDKRAKLIINA